MDETSTAEIVGALEKRVLVVLWGLTIGLWLIAVIGFAVGGFGRVAMIGALLVMFAAFVASFVVMARAGIKSRR